MDRFDAFYARTVADRFKQEKYNEAIDKIYKRIFDVINKGYDGIVMWQHQYPDMVLSDKVADFFRSKGYTASFDIKDRSLHISW